MTAPLLEVAGLRLVRGARVTLELEELTVREGEVLAVIGPNGAGKSSLLQSVNLLVPATFRRYRFDGADVDTAAGSLALRRRMAYVFQEPLLLDDTVLRNSAQGLRLRGVSRREALERADRWLDRLGVGHLKQRHARLLSGGEAQRVSLARALALEPRLLLLDEPFGALDVLTRGVLLKELRPILRESGTTALLVTHDVTEVALLADRVIVLEAGRLVQEGTPRAVFANPQSDLVRQMAATTGEMMAVLGGLFG